MSNPLKDVQKLLKGKNWACGSGDGDKLWGDKLWDIVSALRGPDNGNSGLKERTTWRLRAVIAPKFFSVEAIWPRPDKPARNEDLESFLLRFRNEIRKDFPAAQAHFINHYVRACWAYWSLVEQPKTKRRKTK